MNSYNILCGFERTLFACLQICVFTGALQLLLYYAVGSQWGISHTTHGVGLPRMSGLMSEPDWYGLVCMIACIFAFIYLKSKSSIFKQRTLMLFLISDVAMLVLCLTRATWVGLFAGLVACYLLTKKQDKGRFVWEHSGQFLIVGLALILAVLCAILIEPDIISKLITRINPSQWLTNDGGAADTRFSAIEIMLYFFAQHPFTGNGAGSMGAISSDAGLLANMGYQYEINAGRGSANIIIANLFDVGVIGTALLAAYFIIVLKNLYKAYKETNDIIDVAYFAAILALLVDFQFNNGLRLCIVWVILGLASSRRYLSMSRSWNSDNES